MEETTQALTVYEVFNHGLASALTVVLILLVTAFTRRGADSFDIVTWFHDNRKRFEIGAVFLVGFSVLSYLVPDTSALMNSLGFNLDAKVPLAFGMGLAALLMVKKRKAEAKTADGGE